MKKDLYKDIRLFLSAIIAVSLFFSCSSVPSGIAEEITYHGEQLHRYLTIIKDVTSKAERSKDTITYYCNQKGQIIIERVGTDSLDDYTYSYTGDTIHIHKTHIKNQLDESFNDYLPGTTHTATTISEDSFVVTHLMLAVGDRPTSSNGRKRRYYLINH